MKYSLDKKFFSVLIAGSLFLEGCQNYKSNDYAIQFRENDYISFIVNPLDFTFEPDIAFIKTFADGVVYEFVFSIDEYFDMLNSSDEYLIFEKDGKCFEINREELKEKSLKIYNNTISNEFIYTAKVMFIISEGILCVSFLPLVCGLGDITKKLKK
ncbi:MAG: hypothetical protein IKE75_01620 [Bacilli bacterium]|nr:hypothetical protein [Bacilli bacterium]